MAQLGQNTGTQLTTDLSAYLLQQKTNANGAVDTTELASIINRYLTTGEQLISETVALTNQIYKRFNTSDIVTAKTEIVTTGLWSNGSGSLVSFYTGSDSDIAGHSGSAASKFYFNVYGSTNTGSADVEFAIAYGHFNGSGSPDLADDDQSKQESKVTYSQYRLALLGTADAKFSVYSGSTAGGWDTNDIYVINIARSNYREKLDAGNLQLTLSGSNGIYKFIDDSGMADADTANGQRVFNIISGSINLGSGVGSTELTPTASNQQGFGLFYPDAGIIVLNPAALSSMVGSELSPSDSGVSEYNHKKLLKAIQGGGDFQARRTENVSTSHYFVRVQNREFNFSNNPTFADSTGSFSQDTFKTDPKVYITTIGLYNDSNELLAVAKTSQPIRKTFDSEALIKVKLDF
jgi:hypothetical protein